MATAKAAATGDGASTTTTVAGRKPPAIHALPVNDTSTPKHVEPCNPAQLPVRPGEDDWTEAELDVLARRGQRREPHVVPVLRRELRRPPLEEHALEASVPPKSKVKRAKETRGS